MGPGMWASSYWGHIDVAASHLGGRCQSCVYEALSEVVRCHASNTRVAYHIVWGHRCLLASSHGLHLLDTELYPVRSQT